jgi:hypothetical protein
MASHTERAIGQLRAVAEQTQAYLSRISTSAERISGLSSSALFGTAGGIFGTAAGVLVALFTGINVAAISTPLTAFGIVAGVLIFRGPSTTLFAPW